ncbi:MAG: hypothetical protein QXI16_04085 [Sulfolobaceae archaeon]
MKAKIIISVILIFTILMTSLAIMPVQTVSASANNDMNRFISNFGLESYSGSIPALIWYLIYYLGSMGFGIFTVGQLVDVMNDPDIKPLINDWIIRTLPGGSDYLLLKQISESGGGAITVNANQWAEDRNQISSMFRNGKLEDMRQSYAWNTEPKYIKFGNEQYKAIVLNDVNVTSTNFPFFNQPSLNYLKSLNLRSYEEENEFSEEFTYNNEQYKIKTYASWRTGNKYDLFGQIYKTNNGLYPTGATSSAYLANYSTGWQRIFYGGGVIPILCLITSDGETNAQGAKYKLVFINWGALRYSETEPIQINFGTYIADYGITADEMAGYSEPAITDKLLRDITPNIQYIQPTDTVTITPDARILQELEQIKAGIRDLDIAVPDVVEVPVTTTTTVIREVVNNQTIINNPAIPDVIADNPALEFDFPEVEKFKVPSLIMSKFPFSIPFDLYNAFSVLQTTKKEPIFTIPIVLPSANISEEIVLDLTEYNVLIQLVRWLVLIGFILMLIVITRNLVKG